MRATRADDYARRILPGALIPALDALAREFAKRPAFLRVINRHVNREVRRMAKRSRR